MKGNKLFIEESLARLKPLGLIDEWDACLQRKLSSDPQRMLYPVTQASLWSDLVIHSEQNKTSRC
jgi:hypothetical protein